jgi:hypothetical protein
MSNMDIDNGYRLTWEWEENETVRDHFNFTTTKLSNSFSLAE